MRCNTVQDALTEPFVVVQGTMGSEKDTEALAKVVEQIKKEWARIHFAPCIVVADRDVKDEDLAKTNMVLVGALNLSRDGWFTGAIWSIEQGEVGLNDAF